MPIFSDIGGLLVLPNGLSIRFQGGSTTNFLKCCEDYKMLVVEKGFEVQSTSQFYRMLMRRPYEGVGRHHLCHADYITNIYIYIYT